MFSKIQVYKSIYQYMLLTRSERRDVGHCEQYAKTFDNKHRFKYSKVSFYRVYVQHFLKHKDTSTFSLE